MKITQNNDFSNSKYQTQIGLDKYGENFEGTVK